MDSLTTNTAAANPVLEIMANTNAPAQGTPAPANNIEALLATMPPPNVVVESVAATTLAAGADSDLVYDIDDISILDKANGGVVIEMLRPTTTGAYKPSGVFFRMLGRDSDAVREVEFRHHTARVKRMATNGTGKHEFDAEAQEQENLELLCAAIEGWSMGETPWTNTVRLKGQHLLPTLENKIAILRHVPDWRVQAEAYAMNRANFMKG